MQLCNKQKIVLVEYVFNYRIIDNPFAQTRAAQPGKNKIHSDGDSSAACSSFFPFHSSFSFLQTLSSLLLCLFTLTARAVITT